MKRILAVDDDQDILQLLGVYLKGKYQFASVRDPNEALQYLAKNELPDLILLDIEMPGMNGITFRKKLNQDPILKNIPVVFLTAGTHYIDQIEQQKHIDFLNKPIIKEDLLMVLDAVFKFPKN